MRNIKEIFSWLACLLGNVVGWFKMVGVDHKAVKQMQSQLPVLSKRMDQLQSGDMAELHHQLYESSQKYLQRGYITTSELDDLNYIFKSYHDLGGNGTGEVLYEKCKALELKPEEM